MNRKIKLIWEFRGEEAEQTAEHHKIHLTEFALKEHLELTETGIEKIDVFHWIAFLLVHEREVFKVRDVIKPVRAEVEE
ncbi:MAG: hypothetical protein K0B10_09625 [Vicingaceae bacterium]|nr:hypothetical protein [Vicingaceae bacterium]